MMKRNIARRTLSYIACGGILLASQPSFGSGWTQGHPGTFFIDESTDFTVPGSECQNTDVNNVTSTLKNALVGDNWSGERFANGNAFPQDLMEGSFGIGGLDALFGDDNALSVYAGHGSKTVLQFGSTHNSECIVNIPTQMRMGRLDGGKNRIFMYLTSCTGHLASKFAGLFKSGSGQHLAYHNSPIIRDNQPRDMYNATWKTSNRNAWLNIMDDRPGFGWNSPVIYTLDSSASIGNWLHFNAHLALQNHHQMGQPPLKHFFETVVNNGGC